MMPRYSTPRSFARPRSASATPLMRAASPAAASMLSSNASIGSSSSSTARRKPSIGTLPRKPPKRGSGGAELLNVVVRVRPPLDCEIERFEPCVSMPDGRTIIVRKAGGEETESRQFVFSNVFDPSCPQQEVYEKSARATVMSVLEGYNACVLAYGPTSTGKTYTMEGDDVGPGAGVIPRAMSDIFAHIATVTREQPQTQFSVRCSYLQVYNETVSDLLVPGASNLGLQSTSNGVLVEGLSEHDIFNERQALQLLKRGRRNRFTAATELNELSSRSHAVFAVVVQQHECFYLNADGVLSPHPPPPERAHEVQKLQQNFRVGKLYLVDLAGSENLRFADATVSRLRESRTINMSLLALGRVVEALSTGGGPVPYRESKLTRILQDSTMHHTLNTLWFAERAQRIENEASVNEMIVLDQKALVAEVKRLRAELAIVIQAKAELEDLVRKTMSEKVGAIQLLDKMSRAIDSLNSENDKLAGLLEDFRQASSEMLSEDRSEDCSGVSSGIQTPYSSTPVLAAVDSSAEPSAAAGGSASASASAVSRGDAADSVLPVPEPLDMAAGAGGAVAASAEGGADAQAAHGPRHPHGGHRRGHRDGRPPRSGEKGENCELM